MEEFLDGIYLIPRSQVRDSSSTYGNRVQKSDTGLENLNIRFYREEGLYDYSVLCLLLQILAP